MSIFRMVLLDYCQSTLPAAVLNASYSCVCLCHMVACCL